MSSKMPHVSEIDPETAYAKVVAGALLVDVREKDEVNQASYDVPNFVNIPLSEFGDRFVELPRDQELVMACRGGVRSLRAAEILVQLSLTKVVNMREGIIGWIKRGLPIKGHADSVAREHKPGGCCETAQVGVTTCCTASSLDI